MGSRSEHKSQQKFLNLYPKLLELDIGLKLTVMEILLAVLEKILDRLGIVL